MKKRTILLLLCAVLLSAGCAKRPEQGGGAQSGAADPAPAVTPAPVEPAPEPEHGHTPVVTGNGGWFVGVDDDVYFHFYDASVLPESALWGEFLAGGLYGGGSAPLCRRNGTTGAVETVLADGGAGRVYYGSGGFYLTRLRDGAARVFFAPLSGDETELCRGELAGISPGGRYAAAIGRRGDDWGALYLFEGARECGCIVPAKGERFELCGVTDGGVMIFARGDGDADAALWQLGADGTTLRLGVLPEDEWHRVPRGEQLVADGDDVWCLLGYYGLGTLAELEEYVYLRATCGAEDSLTPLHSADAREELPRMLLAGPGDVMLVDRLPDELDLSENTSGDLIWYDSPYSAVVPVRDFVPWEPYENGGLIVQAMQAVGGAAYVVVADARYDPDGDVGWRQSYDLVSVHTLRIPLRENAEIEPLDGAEYAGSVIVPEDEERYRRFLGTWSMTQLEGGEGWSLPGPDAPGMRLTVKGDRSAICELIGPAGEECFAFANAALVPLGEELTGEYALALGCAPEETVFAYFEGDETLVATLFRTSGDRLTGIFERIW